MVEWKVASVMPDGPLRLAVQFVDGTEGAVRFEASALTGVFEPLLDPLFFDRVFVDHGAVTWPGEVELAPDAMYDEIRSKGEWIIS